MSLAAHPEAYENGAKAILRAVCQGQAVSSGEQFPIVIFGVGKEIPETSFREIARWSAEFLNRSPIFRHQGGGPWRLI